MLECLDDAHVLEDGDNDKIPEEGWVAAAHLFVYCSIFQQLLRIASAAVVRDEDWQWNKFKIPRHRSFKRHCVILVLISLTVLKVFWW